MTKGKQRFAGAILVLFALAPLAVAQDYVHLQQVLRSAALKTAAEDANTAVARAQLEYLEAASRRKFELRPQIGLLSLSNPALLATSIGAGLLFGHQGGPSKFAIQSARADVMLAELAQERAKLRREIEAVHRYFDLLERQQAADLRCAAFDEARKRRVRVERLIREAKLTALDRVRHDEQTLDRESECTQAEGQRRLAAVQLASYAGVAVPNGDLWVQDPVSPALDIERLMPTSEKLVQVALTFRKEPKSVRETEAAIRKELDAGSRLPQASFSLGYRNMSNSAGVTSYSAQNYLMGGNIVNPEVSLRIPLRNNGERGAERALLNAKFRAVETELKGLEEDLRNELESMRILADSRVERLTIAKKKRELSSQGRNLVAIRFQHGLGNATILIEAERENATAQAELLRAKCELKASVFSVLVLCGVHEKPVQLQAQVLDAGATSVTGAH